MNIESTAARIRSLWHSPQLSSSTAEEWLTPDRTSYAIAWLIASLVVEHRFPETALDAIPLYAPAIGWDRFVLTRRISCDHCDAELANAFGQLQLGPGGTVNLTDPAGTVQVAFFPAEADQLLARLDHVLQALPVLELRAGDHRSCQHRRAPLYPQVFTTMARLVAAEPSLVVAREIFIDVDLIDGMRHPLWAHTARQESGYTYDWFGLRRARSNTAAFVRISGQQVIYRTDRSTWASHSLEAESLTTEVLSGQLQSWLGLAAPSSGGLR